MKSILKYTFVFLYGVYLGNKCSANKKYAENSKNKTYNEQQYNNLENKIQEK